nr:hypothetical protein [Tanacetum cinerariifolium]
MGVPRNIPTSLSVRAKKRFGKAHRRSKKNEELLPKDVLVSVFARVASSSFEDLYNAKLSVVTMGVPRNIPTSLSVRAKKRFGKVNRRSKKNEELLPKDVSKSSHLGEVSRSDRARVLRVPERGFNGTLPETSFGTSSRYLRRHVPPVSCDQLSGDCMILNLL